MSATKDIFLDGDFWEWYHDIGPSYLMTYRLDILEALSHAYKDTVTICDGDNFKYVGLASEISNALNKMSKPNQIKREKQITNAEIRALERLLSNLKKKGEE